MIARYCCEILKEQGGKNRMIVTGVRWDESVKRKNGREIYETIASDIKNKIVLKNDNDDRRQLFENCRLKAKRVCNPIIEWADSDVWGFIKSEKIAMNPLYNMGFHRVGCIGCPMARKRRYFEFRVFPSYEQMYRHAFDRMVIARKDKGLHDKSNWSSGNNVFQWWMNENPDQITFADLAEMGGEED